MTFTMDQVYVMAGAFGLLSLLAAGVFLYALGQREEVRRANTRTAATLSHWKADEKAHKERIDQLLANGIDYQQIIALLRHQLANANVLIEMANKELAHLPKHGEHGRFEKRRTFHA